MSETHSSFSTFLPSITTPRNSASLVPNLLKYDSCGDIKGDSLLGSTGILNTERCYFHPRRNNRRAPKPAFKYTCQPLLTMSPASLGSLSHDNGIRRTRL